MENIILPTNPDHVIENYREVEANIHTLYKAITNPAHLARWWGPKGFTNTFNEFDFKPGGRWSFVMYGPDKSNYDNECIFLKIEEPSLIIFNHVSPPEFQVVLSLTEISPLKTEITFQQVFKTATACAKLKDFCLEKNEENLDRLEQELFTMQKQ